MKATIVSAYDTQGMQVNGYLLHRWMVDRGHDSRMVVYRKGSQDERVRELGSPALRRLNALTTRWEYRIGTHCVLPVLSSALGGLPEIRDADVVNLQLIHNAPLFSLLNLPALSRRARVVLSLHDMFFFTGHCVHAMDCPRWLTGCGGCPDLKNPFAVAWDSTGLNWNLKRAVFERSRVDLVVGSPWMRERVARSPILQHLPLHYIPFGVDETVFRPRDRAAARAKLGIPADADVFAFRSSPSGDNPFKGTPYVEEALQRYEPRRDTWLVTFDGVGGLESLRGTYRFVELGWVPDQDSLAEALSAADLLLMPSIAESFGLMAIEAMGCGTPSVVFEGTALPDTVGAPESGIAVPSRDARALAAAITRLMTDDAERARLRENGLRKFAREYTFERYARGYEDLFRGVMARPIAS